MIIKGAIKEIKPAEKINEKFSKRQFIVVDDGVPAYPQYIPFLLYGDRMALLDKFAIDEIVKVTFSINGRQWTAPDGSVKYILSLVASEIEKVSGGGIF